MKAQIVLTTAESKKLLASAVVEMDVIKRALRKGLIVIHPSSTTWFILERLVDKIPEGVWLVGMIVPRGLCIEGRMLEHRKRNYLPASSDFRLSWVLRNGKYEEGIPLSQLLEEMDENCVYIKGVNAIDPQGNVGALHARKGGGTIGMVHAASKKKRFNILIPIGFEKLIPVNIREASKAIGAPESIDHAMGIPVGLYPISAKNLTVITEVKALKFLTGVDATVISCGGLAGAEGAVTLLIKGNEDQVHKTLKMIDQTKGAQTPKATFFDCSDCGYPLCHFAQKKQGN